MFFSVLCEYTVYLQELPNENIIFRMAEASITIIISKEVKFTREAKRYTNFHLQSQVPPHFCFDNLDLLHYVFIYHYGNAFHYLKASHVFQVIYSDQHLLVKCRQHKSGHKLGRSDTTITIHVTRIQ
mmetsp:Transcript_18573/g.27223  ORF Transcript_18573/g.27223 Transcript_18573/m.27223 type:complete len:127 (+) Transcript_18573:162-542(+)